MKPLFALILLASAAWAQSTDAVVSGNVLDPSGASVPTAIITALNLNTGVKTVVTSNASGVYLFAALPPGQYRFSAEKEKFKRLDLNETTVRIGRDFGAAGDGTTLDTAAVQRAIDAAAAAGGRVIVPGGRSWLVGTLELRGGIDFHLADDAVLLASIRPEDYTGGASVVAAVRGRRNRIAGLEPDPAERAANLLTAHEAHGLSLSGTSRIDGRFREFMASYDEKDEWWRPGPFRPNLAVLFGCRDLEVRDLTFHNAPIRSLHLVGCDSPPTRSPGCSSR